MAMTFAPVTRHVYSIGDRKEAIIDVGYSGTPTVGGDALTATALGFSQLDTVDPIGVGSNAGITAGYTIAIVHAATAFVTQVLVGFMVQGTAGAGNPLIAATGALTAGSFRVRAVGKGLVSGPSS